MATDTDTLNDLLERIRVERNVLEAKVSGLQPNPQDPAWDRWEEAMVLLGKIFRNVIKAQGIARQLP